MSVEAVQELHKPIKRTAVYMGGSHIAGFNAKGERISYTPPRPGTPEFDALVRRTLETPECEHCRTDYPCATVTALSAPAGPGARP